MPKLTKEEIARGVGPLTLGPRKRRLDTSRWDEFCEKVIGRRVPFGGSLTFAEIKALGFTEAWSELTGQPKEREEYDYA